MAEQRLGLVPRLEVTVTTDATTLAKDTLKVEELAS
jgi:hypothetical protein